VALRQAAGRGFVERDKVGGQPRLSVAVAARLAGVHRDTIYAWIARGRLQALPGDDGYRIAAADLVRLLAARRAATATGVRLGTLLRWTETAGVAD
jgi:excisionase family DNA binding protein